MGLYRQLEELRKSDFYPFHMPGHKRCEEEALIKGGLPREIYGIDITEIDGFDNLHDAQGILKEAQQRANRLYLSVARRLTDPATAEMETFFLINGSTAGVLAAVSAAVCRGGTLLTMRNSHKSLYHAAYLNRLKLDYIASEYLPEGLYGGVCLREMERHMMTRPDAVFLTSPTYEGIPSDIRSAASLAHAHGLPLIVDEAHGAHFGLSPELPEGALEQGADIVIHSVHKTLASLTQTALLHVQGSLVDRERLKRFLRIYQSSSPSYVLMASIDACMEDIGRHGKRRFERLIAYKERLLAGTREHVYIRVLGESVVPDPCKAVVSCKGSGISGQRLYGLLRERFHLQPEMAGETYVVMILTGYDTGEGVERLIDALRALEAFCREAKRETEDKKGRPEKTENGGAPEEGECIGFPAVRMTLADAWDAAGETIPLAHAAGRIAAEFIGLYPPGIPLIVPGEAFDAGIIAKAEAYAARGMNTQGISRRADGKHMVKAVSDVV